MVYDNVPNDLMVSIDRWGPSKSSAGQTGLTQDCQDHPRSTRVGKSCKTWKKNKDHVWTINWHILISVIFIQQQHWGKDMCKLNCHTFHMSMPQKYLRSKYQHSHWLHVLISRGSAPCYHYESVTSQLVLPPAPRWSFSAELREGKTDPATTFH